MASLIADGGQGADRLGSARELIRRLAAAAFVGLVVGGGVGGVIGRLAMRLLAITSDDRLKGMLTDDEAEVNQFTAGGTIGFVIFMALGGAVLAWGYLAVRAVLPAGVGIRAAVFGALFLALQGSTVFDPDGFDFTRLSPIWLAVLLFVVIFAAVGALIAVGVERALPQWTDRPVGWLPLAPLVLVFPVFLFAIIVSAAVWVAERWPPVRYAGAAALVASLAFWGGPTTANVIRILV